MAIIGYARVSKKEQNIELQLDALTKYGCDKIYQEKASARKNRTVFNEIIKKLSPEDTLVVWKLDRLGRSNLQLVELMSDFKRKKIRIVATHDCLNTMSSTGKLHFNLLSVFAEYERDIIIERTIAGLDAARKRGVILGRPRGLTTEAHLKALRAAILYKEGEKTNDICKKTEISRATLYKYLSLKEIKLRINKD